MQIEKPQLAVLLVGDDISHPPIRRLEEHGS
jgi:hypothetical protein